MKAVIIITSDTGAILFRHTVDLPTLIPHYQDCLLGLGHERIEGFVFSSYGPGQSLTIAHHTEAKP